MAVIAAASMFFIKSANAQWKLFEYKDSMTDKVTTSAYVKSSEGHSLTVFRASDGAVSMSFHLNDASRDLIEARGIMQFRIDGNPPATLPYSWKPRFAVMKLWHGKTELGRNEALIQLMSGQRLLFRYPIFNGGSSDIQFTLEGAKDVLASALGLQSAIGDGTLEKAEAENALTATKRKATMELAEQCKANAVKEDYSVCMARGR
jgi:hypothetical protein